MTTSLWQLLQNYKIVIPIVQRDYAQGREYGKVPLIRENFLNALSSALKVNEAPLELDFVYGYTKENQNKNEKRFIPLDGQQRLTTLFLLHWYIAVKEDRLEEAQNHLLNFTYETRHSSRVFCNKLVEFNPEDLEKPIKDTVINQPWFFTAWKNDPTISSMLIMLDEIQRKFRNIDNVWPKLTSDQPSIVFHLLPMEKLGLPDDLYIKMNSRGKELTDFEYFKSRFSEILPTEYAEIFNIHIDQLWSDLFWSLYKDQEGTDIAKLVDNGFLRFFRYITDILIFKNDINVEHLTDEFDKIKAIYSDETNVVYLFSCLNVFGPIYNAYDGFFDSVFYTKEDEFSIKKVRLFFQNAQTDLFKKCADSYDPANRINPFSIGEQLMLYACIEHITHNTEDFSDRIRKVRNLIANSDDTVRKENMPSLLITVSEIIGNNFIDEKSKFNSTQINEEKSKPEFIDTHNDLKEIMYKLEDHHLLRGCLAIFNLNTDLKNYANCFSDLFSSNNSYDEISRALLCFGDYSQIYDWRNRFGNNNDKVWRELFTPSQRRTDFSRTKEVLNALLSHLIQTPQTTLQEINAEYLASYNNEPNMSKDWKYYFIKYSSFRRSEDGFYHWPNPEKSFELIMMRRSQYNGFHWSPFLFTLREKLSNQVSLDNWGSPLIFTKNNISLKIINLNNGYKVEATEDVESQNYLQVLRQSNLLNSDDVFEISQNQDDLDLEDRIERGINLISQISELSQEVAISSISTTA